MKLRHQRGGWRNAKGGTRGGDCSIVAALQQRCGKYASPIWIYAANLRHDVSELRQSGGRKPIGFQPQFTNPFAQRVAIDPQ